MPCVRRKNHYEKRKASLSFIITILVVVLVTLFYCGLPFLFIVVCIQYETGSADQQ